MLSPAPSQFRLTNTAPPQTWKQHPNHSDQSWMNYYKKSGRLAVNILIASKLKERQRKSLSFSTGNKGAPPPNNEQNHPPPPQQQQQRPQQPHPSTNGTAPSSIANGNGNEASAAKSVTSARGGPARNGEATSEEEIDELASNDGEAEDDRPLPRASTSAARPAPSPATRKRVPYNDRDKKRLVKLLARGQMVGWTQTRVYLELATDVRPFFVPLSCFGGFRSMSLRPLLAC